MTRKAEKAIDAIRRLIDDGQYPVNTRLPPERELARKFGISRGLVRNLLGRLEAEGRIWRHVGQGTFVGGRAPASESEITLISSQTSPAEVFEARLAIEPQCAWHAAMRATSEDVAHIQHCLQKMDRAPNTSNYFRWDATFHRAIGEAARNRLLLSLFDALNATRAQVEWAEMFHASMDASRRETTQQQHHQIVEAIVRRSAATAERLSRHHIEDVRGYLLGS